MSATRDTSQKIGWSHQNIYRIYKEGSKEQPVVNSFNPLKRNVEELQKLHAELKRMIDELEQLIEE